jgi:hypothetical protein
MSESHGKKYMKKMKNDPDMLVEYDFSKGVRGKYIKKQKNTRTSGTKRLALSR